MQIPIATDVTQISIELTFASYTTCISIASLFTIQRTSDSLNEGLPIKMTRENDIFSIKKIVCLTLDLSTKVVFSLDKYLLKNMG